MIRNVPLYLSGLLACAAAHGPVLAHSHPHGQAASQATPPAQAQSQSPAQAQALKCSPDASSGLTYPVSKRVDHVDEYHGVKVADPYRWLENANSDDTRAWVEAQNKLTQGVLAQIPAREAIRQRLSKLWNYERVELPAKEGGRYFFRRNDGLQNQSVLYTMKNLEDTPRALLDPNTLSADGTVALGSVSVSRSGKHLLYGVAESGSDWTSYKVRDIETGKDLDDLVKWSKFSVPEWAADGEGFYYMRYDEPKEAGKLADISTQQRIYFHKLGTPQSADTLVYERPESKDLMFEVRVTEDGNHLIILAQQGGDRKDKVYVKNLRQKDAKFVPLVDTFEANFSYIGNVGSMFWFMTDSKAEKSRVVAIDSARPEPANWKEIVPEAQESLRAASIVGKTLVASYLKDARSQVKVFGLDGKFLREVELPGLGTAGGFDGKPGDTETFFSFTNASVPKAIYRYDVKTGKSVLWRQPKVAFDPAAYETRQVFYTSKDGTKVPMFISHRKGMKLDGTNPTYLFGYGGFKQAMTPQFSVANLAWMEMGGVHVTANLRGGGEYGEAWHKAGIKLRKQNTFDDFIAAGEWLIANKVTSPAKLAIAGGSNGGLLVGAAMTQRPELFGAALPAVGVMDMLRFHKFTIGWAWTGDYGSSDNPEEFKSILAYSPLHNLRQGTCYPPTLITTADHDDRVVPAHSYKFAAAAQAAQGSAAPVLIRIESKAGHGAGKPTTKQIAETADRWAFLAKSLDMKVAAAQK